MPQPWERDWTGQSAQGTSAPATPPSFIPGTPDPYKARDQQLQEQAAVRSEQQFQATQAREERRDQRAEAKDAQGTESERTAGFLTNRIVNGIGRLTTAGKRDKEALAPSFGVEAVRKVVGDSAANYMTDADRQIVRAAQMDVLDAALTLGTGAAYTKEQLAGYAESYFPQLGDDPATIASKQQALMSLLESARIKAGKAAPDIEAAMASLAALNAPTAPDNGDGTDISALQERYGNEGLVGGVTDDSPTTPSGPAPIDGNSPGYAHFAAGVGDLVEGGINNTVGLVGNPLGRVIMEATGYGGKEYNMGQIVRDGLGLPEGTGWIGEINQAASGGFGIAGAANKLSGAINNVPVRNALLELGKTPFRDAAANAGATVSGQAAQAAGAGPVAQVAAQVAGGAATFAAPNALLAAGRRSAAPPDLNRNVLAAGERLNVPVRMGDAVPSARNRTAVAEAKPYSGPIMRRAMDGDTETLRTRVREQGDEGQPQTEAYPLGESVSKVGDRYIERTRNQKNVNYTKAEQLAGGARVSPANAIAEVDRNIAELKASGANSNAATISYLEGLKADLSKGEGFSISEFQQLRSGAGKKIKGDNALTVSDADRRLGNVVRAFNQDAKGQLPPQAAEALERADAFYAERQTFIKGTLQKLMGTRGQPRSPEDIGRAFRGMVANKADYDRLSGFLKEATPEEVADFRATIAEDLVTGKKGEVGAAQLATNVAGIPRNIRKLIFGEDGARALDDVITMANAKGETKAGLNNSKSGVVGAAQIGLRSVIGSIFGATLLGPVGAAIAPVVTEVATALGQARMARLLLNPDITKWIRQTPNTTNVKPINAHFGRLKDVAARSPIIANDARALQSALAEAFKNSPQRAAAEPERDKVRDSGRVPPKQ